MLEQLEKFKFIFITATDTNIGKTAVSIYISKYFSENKNLSVGYYKPIQTGDTGIEDEVDVLTVKKHCPKVKTHCTYSFKLAATPELAAKQEDSYIDFQKIKDDLENFSKDKDIVLIEGAGGLFVPIGQNKTMANLIKYLNIPCLLVSANKLGTINHSCLSLYYMKSLELKIIGFCFFNPSNQNSDEKKVLKTNADFIESYSNCKFLGEVI